MKTLDILRGVEALIHTVSNLEEKFHQSFYYYLLPNNENLISIGEYYIPLVLIVLPCATMMLQLLIRTGGLQASLAMVFTFLSILSSSTILLLAIRTITAARRRWDRR